MLIVQPPAMCKVQNSKTGLSIYSHLLQTRPQSVMDYLVLRVFIQLVLFALRIIHTLIGGAIILFVTRKLFSNLFLQIRLSIRVSYSLPGARRNVVQLECVVIRAFRRRRRCNTLQQKVAAAPRQAGCNSRIRRQPTACSSIIRKRAAAAGPEVQFGRRRVQRRAAEQNSGKSFFSRKRKMRAYALAQLQGPSSSNSGRNEETC